jgi:predicted transcriptional regulator
MAKHNDESESAIFQALAHPMRRTIIRILETKPNGVDYTELITDLGLPTGKMNYHLEQLEGLIERNGEHRYVLTSLGKKALNQLKQLKAELTVEDEKYLKLSRRKHRRQALNPQ